MALEEELEEVWKKYKALQQTWMAVNENFLRFQVFLEINKFWHGEIWFFKEKNPLNLSGSKIRLIYFMHFNRWFSKAILK